MICARLSAWGQTCRLDLASPLARRRVEAPRVTHRGGCATLAAGKRSAGFPRRRESAYPSKLSVSADIPDQQPVPIGDICSAANCILFRSARRRGRAGPRKRSYTMVGLGCSKVYSTSCELIRFVCIIRTSRVEHAHQRACSRAPALAIEWARIEAAVTRRKPPMFWRR